MVITVLHYTRWNISELIKSAKELQQEILQTDNLVTNEDIEFLEHWLMEHLFNTDQSMGTYLAMEM